MMASGVSTYVNRFAAAPGQRAAIFTVTDSGWHTAQDLVAAGVEVAAVIDARSQEHSFATMLRGKGVECLSGVVESVQGSRVRRLTVRLSNGKTRRLDVDLLAMAGGWNPAIGIASNLGARPEWSDEINSFVIGIPPPGMVAAGARCRASVAGASARRWGGGSLPCYRLTWFRAPATPTLAGKR